MNTSISLYNIVTCAVSDGINWPELYPRLHAVARNLVYRHRIPCWYGQEEDVAEDVVQETVRRLIERIQKAARGEAAPIDAPEQMMVTIAYNYVIDLTRRERRLIHLPAEELTSASRHGGNDCMRLEEVATEQIYDEWLFLQLAHEIAHFPDKQRRAILIDLANRTCFDERPTPLQRAFLAVGIDLQVYQQSLPDDPAERAQHASSLYWAYKRLTQLAFMKEETIAA